MCGILAIYNLFHNFKLREELIQQLKKYNIEVRKSWI